MGRGPTMRFAVLALLAAVSSAPHAATLELQIDDGRRPLADVVVELDAPGMVATATPTRHVINQKDETFVPWLTVLNRGDSIEFRNSDYTRHHVYTFSPVHPFEFVVPSGATSESVTFDSAGVAAIGCNIHDRMIAYVYVSAAARTGRSGADGRVVFENLEPGPYALRAWHPRLRTSGRGLEQSVVVPAGGGAPVTLSLRVDAGPPAGDRERSVY